MDAIGACLIGIPHHLTESQQTTLRLGTEVLDLARRIGGSAFFAQLGLGPTALGTRLIDGPDQGIEQRAQAVWMCRAPASGDIVHLARCNEHLVSRHNLRLQAFSAVKRLGGTGHPHLAALHPDHPGERPAEDSPWRTSKVHRNQVAGRDLDVVSDHRFRVHRIHRGIAIQELHATPCTGARGYDPELKVHRNGPPSQGPASPKRPGLSVLCQSVARIRTAQKGFPGSAMLNLPRNAPSSGVAVISQVSMTSTR